jgi:hypothetical protein
MLCILWRMKLAEGRDPRIGAIAVQHRDWLARFGSEYIEAALQSTGREVVLEEEGMLEAESGKQAPMLSAFAYGRIPGRPSGS